MNQDQKNKAPGRPSDWKERKQQLLTRASPSDAPSIARAFALKDEAIFLVTRNDGLIPLEPANALGIYHHDCRFLNGYAFSLNGQVLELLGSSPLSGNEARFEFTNHEFSTESGQNVHANDIITHLTRAVDGRSLAIEDEVSIFNFTREQTIDLQLEFAFNADFEDLFVVRGMGPTVRGEERPPTWQEDNLILSYRGADLVERSTTISFSRRPDEMHESVAQFHLRLAPGAGESIKIGIVLQEKRSGSSAPKRAPNISDTRQRIQRDEATFRDERAHISTDNSEIDGVLERSFSDLLMLRTPQDDEIYFAAGVPWFTTLFGRDSLLTALFVLPYHTRIAENTLRLLAKHQGRKVDDWRDEEPGKILHELRVGELANLGQIPHTPYYGTVDATPLFLLLLARHATWTGRLDLFEELRPNVEAALEWLDKYGERKQLEGYVGYDAEPGDLLVNQGWKDSGDGIIDENGRIVCPPIALVEVQGYTFAAKVELARLYARAGDAAMADRLQREANELRIRFNRDFWVAERDYYALALVSGGKPLRVISSNPGHALFSGIADADKAMKTAQLLLAKEMFSGWGVRTLATNEKGYNPLAYHRGTVWPHDNALIVAGLQRYGCNAEAVRIVGGMIDAATHFSLSRLPEVFSGLPRADYDTPIRYPVACHPQAWSAGSIPFMLVSLLGLEPNGFDKSLRIRQPTLPRHVNRLQILGLTVGEGRVDLVFQRVHDDAPKVSVLRTQGDVEIIYE